MTVLTKLHILRNFFILLLFAFPGLAHAAAVTDKEVSRDEAVAGEDGTFQASFAQVARDQSRTIRYGVERLRPGYGEQTLPGQLEGILREAAEYSTREGEDQSLKARVQAIADRLAADEEEKPLQDAFVHEPDELDDLAVPVQFRDAVAHYIGFFAIKKRKMFTSWLRRAKQYAPVLREILRDHDLPEDLVYLAMIESGFNPRAYSRAKACGPWQFISATGQRYGLRIDHWVDERRDFEKATVAAARYLKDLFERFGCWYLAASGYNAGEGRVESALRRHRTTDYWDLYRYNTLPRETREYVPQLIAAATIAENPESYGFADTTVEGPPAYCTMEVPGGTPLHLVAAVSSSDLSEIRSLNPELLTKITPPGKRYYALKLPEDASLELFDERLKSRLRGNRVIGTVRVTSKRRPSLSRILRRYGATRPDLALVNKGSGRVSSANPLYIPLFDEERVSSKKRQTAKLTSYRKVKARNVATSRKGGAPRAESLRSSKSKKSWSKKRTKKTS